MSNEQRNASANYQLLKPDKLFRNLNGLQQIDSLVKNYPQYTHDDIYEMEWIFVHKLQVLNATNQYINSRMQELARK